MSGIKEAKRKRIMRERRRRILRIAAICGPIILCIVLIVGIRAIITRTNKAEDPVQKQAETAAIDTSSVDVEPVNLDIVTQPESSKPIKITVSSTGDCTLGTDSSFNPDTSLPAYYNSQGADYFLQNVRSVFEKDDLTIVNMEGTLTTSEERQDKTFAFKADPAYSAILANSSVEAANLANNHSQDYGESSYTDTIKALEDDSVSTFGYERTKVFEVKGVKIGVTGIYELAEHLDVKEDVERNIAALEEQSVQVIIVNFHWGNEREYIPNDIQKELAHYAVDQGADLVIGHHPHVLQGVEEYKNRYIAYSLGNFCFGGNQNPDDKDTMIFQTTFTIEDGKLTDATDINIIPCSISSSSGYNDYCPTILDGDEKERVLKKIEDYSNEL